MIDIRKIEETVLALALLISTACGDSSVTSGGGQLSQAEIDQRAFELAGGEFTGWLAGSSAWERRPVPQSHAAHDGTIVLGDDSRGQPVEWVAGVMVHEACHHRGGTQCSAAEEARCIREQIEFDRTVRGRFIDHLEGQIGVHTCGAAT